MSQLVRRQDLPPPGGYQPIPYLRMPAKQVVGAKSIFAIYAAVTAGSLYLYSLNNTQVKKERIESRSARMAMYPLMLAEKDRDFLKQVNRNRAAEAKLMKDVEGWEVGTWYGERIYKTIDADAYVDPSFQDYYCHSDPSDYLYAKSFKLYF